MMDLMRPWNTIWFAAATLTLGLWAGGASAQADEGGWFDSESSSSEPSERPVLKIHGEGPYDPPPADFRSEPAAPTYDDEPAEVVDEATEAEGQRQAVREFSPHLAPYGRWVDDPYYGRIWVPARSVVGRDFAPYVSAGHWELTVNDEWLWASDYPFGWVTFHYGRWVWGSGYGWGWVPGYRYAPAWVDFRIGAAGYVGWGPSAPYYAWRSGVFVSLGVRRPLPYVFCPTPYVFGPSLHRHVIRDRYRVRSIGAQTYRYRPQRVAGVYARSPRLVEAGIPSRAVPTRRVVARPRVGDSEGNILRSRSRAPSGIERRASLRDPAVRRDAFPAAQPVRRSSAGRASTMERFDSRGSSFRSARPTGRDTAVRRAGDVRRGGDVRRSNAIPQSRLRSTNAVRRNPSAWTDATPAAGPRLAAPRVREPATDAAVRRAAPAEPARATGTERRSEARGSSRSNRSSGRQPAARPSERSRARTERGSSR